MATTLLTRGRLSLPQLAQFTSIKPRSVRASLLVLIQHNLAWHTQSDDDGEVFELNPEECLLRLRFGRVVWQTEQLLGTAVRHSSVTAGARAEECFKAADIVSLILDHGKLRPPDIMTHLCHASSKGKLCNHSLEAKYLNVRRLLVSDSSLYSQALYKLVSSSYLSPSTVLFHISPRDKLLQYEIEEKKQIKNFPTAKELRQAKERAEARLNREQEEAMKVGLTVCFPGCYFVEVGTYVLSFRNERQLN